MAVLKAQQLRSVLVPAARFLPKLRGLHDGHCEFHGPCRIHFLTDDVFNLLHHAQPHGHDRVDACRDLLDETGTDGKFLTRNFRVRGSFLQGRDEKLACTHGPLTSVKKEKERPDAGSFTGPGQ